MLKDGEIIVLSALLIIIILVYTCYYSIVLNIEKTKK